MPDRFGKKTSPSWRTWSYLAKDFVGVVHTALKQAMKNAENHKQPISVTHLQHDLGVTNEMDQELQHFEALEVVRGAEREPEDWLLCMTHWQLEEVWTTTAKSCLHRKPTKWRTSVTPSKPGKTSNKDTENALETSYSKTCDLLFFSPCAPPFGLCANLINALKLLANQQEDGDCLLQNVVANLGMGSRKGLTDGLREFIKVDSERALDVGSLRQGTGTFQVRKPKVAEGRARM